MKKLKLILVVIAAFVCLNVVFAGNPANKDYTKNLADNMVNDLSKDINLTDSQKIVIQTIAKKYETKLRSVNNQANSNSKKVLNKQVVVEFRTRLDSVLTKEQIEILKAKRIERLKSAINNNQTKN
ncbi:MAG: hypothetical protein VB110_07445 [Bacteroidales bacterium]|nr:hypothetical protein [Bacteroidales bacterium]